jgi:hypothetical protein
MALAKSAMSIGLNKSLAVAQGHFALCHAHGPAQMKAVAPGTKVVLCGPFRSKETRQLEQHIDNENQEG